MTNALPLPLPQSSQFAAAMHALGRPVRCVKADLRGAAQMRWLVQSRGLRYLGRVDLISRGPVAQDPEAARDWLGRFKRWHDGRPLLVNAEGLRADDLRQAGFWPLFTASSLAIAPLGPPKDMRAALHQKWRNRLNKAETLRLKVVRPGFSATHWLLEHERRSADLKGYKGYPPAFALAYASANPADTVLFEASLNGHPVAAALFLRHGPMATWHIGQSTPDGRRANAMNLILWHAMVWLAERGHTQLDLGILNTDDAPGLSRFKLGTGAKLVTLSGSWLHLKALAPIARHLPQRLAA